MTAERTIQSATIYVGGRAIATTGPVSYTVTEPTDTGPPPFIENRVYSVECELTPGPGLDAFMADLRKALERPRRQKHRVGVHCERQGSDARDEKRIRDRHDRWLYVAGVRSDWVNAWDFARCQRPSERARRFFGGERRSVRRRRGGPMPPSLRREWSRGLRDLPLWDADY